MFAARTTASTTPFSTSSTLRTSSKVQNLLKRLYAISTEQENAINPGDIEAAGGFDAYMRDKFIALDQDKSEFIYQLLLAKGARNVVEAGTSFGVSTIYLALGVSHNLRVLGGDGVVIATENEASKAAKAREYWKEAGEEVEQAIDLREGDLRKTLKANLPSFVDLLLLDIWAPLALPTLDLVEKNFRPGSIVIVDNITGSAERYKELIEHLHTSGRYTNLVLPYDRGLGLSVYTG